MKVLIAGLGSIAKKHIAALRALDDNVEIHALRSRMDSPSYDGVANVYTLEECDADFDFAIISNPTSLHASTIRQLLGLRIPLFIEKPIFESVAYEPLIDEIEQSGVLTYVACNLRYLDCLRYMHDYIHDNPQRRVNEVNVYCGSYLPQWRPGTDWRNCYSARPELGGGVNIDLIHDIDYTCWIFGMPGRSMGIGRNVSSLDIKSVDYAAFLLFYSGFTASVTLNYYRRDYRRRLEVLFEDDTWTVDIAANRITDMNGNVVYQGENSIPETYLAQMDDFITVVRTGGRAENDARAAYGILKICMDYERLE